MRLRPLWTWTAWAQLPVRLAAAAAAVCDANVVWDRDVPPWRLGAPVVLGVLVALVMFGPSTAWLSAADGRAAAEAFRTGLASGRPKVDALVRERLERAVRTRTAYALAGGLLIVALVVAAAVRGGPLWLLTAAPIVLPVAPSLPSWVIDPVDRLERFEATV